jgi:hypothetical protein
MLAKAEKRKCGNPHHKSDNALQIESFCNKTTHSGTYFQVSQDNAKDVPF